MKRSDHVSQRMKLQHLRVFLAVAQTGGMTKAARQLATSQSVVSKSVGELEDMLGVPLFERNSQGAEPTLYGRALLKGGVAIFDDLKASVDEIAYLAVPGVGELRVAANGAHAALASATMKRLSQKHPGLDFRLFIAETRVTITELRERRIDLVVGPMPSDGESDLDATFLYNNRLRVVVGLRSPWLRRRKVELRDLIGEPWCLGAENSPSRVALAEAFRASGLPAPRVVFSSTSTYEQRQWIADGRSIGILGDGTEYFAAKIPPIKILPINLAAPSFLISVICLKNRVLGPAAPLFIEAARAITAPLRDRRN